MNELTLERELLGRAVVKSIPMNGSIELLPLCNMNCRMCYIRLSKEEMNQKGSMRSKDEWLNLGRQMAEAGTMFLLLTGGEPLLYPEFKELYIELQKLGMILTVNTNGTLIDEDWVDFFRNHRPRRINITLYGTSRETYRDLCRYEAGFEKVMNSIRMLREADIDVKINGSIVKSNQDDYQTIHALAKKLDCAVNLDTHMQPSIREEGLSFSEQARLNPEDAARIYLEICRDKESEEEFKHRIQEIVEAVELVEEKPADPIGFTCLAGRCSYTINWQGKMRPCVMLPEPEVDVFELGFAEGWKQIQSNCQKIRISQACCSCKYRMICTNCPAAAYLETGSYEGIPSYVCRYAKGLYQTAKKML